MENFTPNEEKTFRLINPEGIQLDRFELEFIPENDSIDMNTIYFKVTLTDGAHELTDHYTYRSNKQLQSIGNFTSVFSFKVKLINSDVDHKVTIHCLLKGNEIPYSRAILDFVKI